MDISPQNGDNRYLSNPTMAQEAQQRSAWMSGSRVADVTALPLHRMVPYKEPYIARSASSVSLTLLPIEVIALINGYLLPRDRISLAVCRRQYFEKFNGTIAAYSTLYAQSQRVGDHPALVQCLAQVDRLKVEHRPAYLAAIIRHDHVLPLLRGIASQWVNYTLTLREQLTGGKKSFHREDGLCALLVVRLRTLYSVCSVDVEGDAKAVASLPQHYWPAVVEGMLTMPRCMHLLQDELMGYPSMMPLRRILIELSGTFAAGDMRVSERALIAIAATRLFDITQREVGRHVRGRFGLSASQLTHTILPGIARLLACACVNGKMSLPDALFRWGPDTAFEEIVSGAFLDVLHLELKIARNRISRDLDSWTLLDVSRAWLWRDGAESESESLDALHLLGFDPIFEALAPNGREMRLRFWHLYVRCKKVRQVRDAEISMVELRAMPLRLQPFLATVLVDQCLSQNICGYTSSALLRQFADWEVTAVRRCLKNGQPGLALRAHVAAIRIGNAHGARCVDLQESSTDMPSRLFSDLVQATISKTPVSEWGCLIEMLSDYPCHQAQGTWSERHAQYLADTMRIFLSDPASRMRYPSPWFVDFALSYAKDVWEPICAGLNNAEDSSEAFCRRFDITGYSSDAFLVRLKAGALRAHTVREGAQPLPPLGPSRKPKTRLSIKSCVIS